MDCSRKLNKVLCTNYMWDTTLGRKRLLNDSTDGAAECESHDLGLLSEHLQKHILTASWDYQVNHETLKRTCVMKYRLSIKYISIVALKINLCVYVKMEALALQFCRCSFNIRFKFKSKFCTCVCVCIFYVSVLVFRLTVSLMLILKACLKFEQCRYSKQNFFRYRTRNGGTVA